MASVAAGLEWHPHPDAWFLVAALIFGYFGAVAVRSRRGDGDVVSTRHKVCWVAGVAAVWAGADWPIHDAGEDFLFSVHMVQHTLFSLVAPPLLLLGAPEWMVRAILRPRAFGRLVAWATRPVIALVIFNGIVLVTHWPVIVDAALRSEPLHFLVHAALVAASLAMWWPVIEPVPQAGGLTEPGKMLYLFLQSVLPTVPASFLTFAQEPIYHFYETVPRLTGLSVVDDQRLAGLIMKLGGGLLLWVAIAIVFFRWSAHEDDRKVGDISWDDFERELEAWNLRG